MISVRRLPGDLEPRDLIESMVRVNHAGEYGARRIYQGQIAVLKNHASVETIRHMAEQEEKHLAWFEREIVRRQVRPTLLHPLWHMAGFALGAATALMGEKAAMACTAAVENVIDRHYGEQLEMLGNKEPELSAAITEFRAEEAEHHATALEAGAEQSFGYPILSAIIKAGCRLAIGTAKRI